MTGTQISADMNQKASVANRVGELQQESEHEGTNIVTGERELHDL